MKNFFMVALFLILLVALFLPSLMNKLNVTEGFQNNEDCTDCESCMKKCGVPHPQFYPDMLKVKKFGKT